MFPNPSSGWVGMSGQGGEVIQWKPRRAMSHCAPVRLISPRLLFRSLFRRRFWMLSGKGGGRGWSRGRDGEGEIVCATSHWHKYLFTTRHKLAPCQSVSISPPFNSLTLPVCVSLFLCATKRITTLPGSALSHYHILITFVKGSIWEFNE